MLKFRVRRESASIVEYGSDYLSEMGWHETDMNYLFGYELDALDVELFDIAINSGEHRFKLFESNWWINTKDIVLSTHIYIKPNTWFVSEYNNIEYWNEIGCIAAESMVEFTSKKVDRLESLKFMQAYIQQGESTSYAFGYSWKLNWFTSVNPIPTKKVGKIKIPSKSCINMNEITIHRGNIQITIMKSLEESDDGVVYFVDGGDGKTYEIPKKLVLPQDDGWYQLKAINTINGADATHILRLLLERQYETHLNLDCFEFTPFTVRCNDVDILIGAVYNIKNLRQEYEKAVYEDSFKEKYPLLSHEDIKFICNEQRKIQGLVEVFETEA